MSLRVLFQMIVLVAMAGLLGACEPRHGFPKAFPSEAALTEWMETSTLGGGTVTRINFADRDIVIAYRTHTSGRESSDAAIYRHEGDAWKFVKGHGIIMDSFIEAETLNDSLIFRATKDGTILFALSPEDLK